MPDVAAAVIPLTSSSEVARRLIDATIEVIDAGGEVAVRVQDVVATVGVQIPVLYRHFGSREGLVQAAQVERLVRDLTTELSQINAAIDAVGTEAEFRSLVDRILARLATPERRDMRWKRVSVLGSTYGRPELAASVAEIQARAIEGIADAFRRPQAEGWLRDGLDLVAFAAWFAGQVLGRVLVEFGQSDVDLGAWDAIASDAVRHVLFG